MNCMRQQIQWNWNKIEYSIVENLQLDIYTLVIKNSFLDLEEFFVIYNSGMTSIK